MGPICIALHWCEINTALPIDSTISMLYKTAANNAQSWLLLITCHHPTAGIHD